MTRFLILLLAALCLTGVYAHQGLDSSRRQLRGSKPDLDKVGNPGSGINGHQASLLRLQPQDTLGKVHPRLKNLAVTSRRRFFDPWTHHQFARTRRPDKCWSQAERHYFHKPLEWPPKLVTALLDHSKMQKRCLEELASSDDLASEKGETGCKYIFPQFPTCGLGNHIMSFTAAFAYALVANRAIVLHPDERILFLFCPPVQDMPLTVDLGRYSKVFSEFYQNSVPPRSEDGHVSHGASAVNVSLSFRLENPGWSFYCPEVQQSINGAKFFFVRSEQYWLPGLYLVPQLKARLDDLFPDRRVFHHLSRFLLHPMNHLWANITRVFVTDLAQHNTRVGIQARDQFGPNGNLVDHLERCAINESGYLPKPQAQGAQPAAPKPSNSIGVFVASLNHTYLDHLRGVYASRAAEDGSNLAFYSLSSDGHEKLGDLKQAEAALVEMWLLSFSDLLLTSAGSTFGYVAAGISGIRPYIVNNQPWMANNPNVCSRGPSEPCFHAFPGVLEPVVKCEAGELRVPFQGLPFLQQCTDFPSGTFVNHY